MNRSLHALFIATLLAAAPAWAQPRTKGVTVTPTDTGTSMTCPTATACFDVSSEFNITHIFVNVPETCASSPSDDPMTITVDGKTITQLHTAGGPCNHGDELVPRTVWFPLQGNQMTARVCVSASGLVPDSISVGAKAADACSFATTPGSCMLCTPPVCPPAAPDMGIDP